MRPTGHPLRTAAAIATAALSILIASAPAGASVVFDGRNFGVAGQECAWSCSSTNNGAPFHPEIAPWSAVQFEKPGGETLGNGWQVITTPARFSGAEAAKITVRSDAGQHGERVQFRRYSLGDPGVSGQDYWFAFSHQFPAGTPVTQFTSLLDVGTKFNTTCAGSASYGGSNGAGVPELYLYNTAGSSSTADPHWLWRVKMAGGTGPTPTPAGGNPCNFRYYDFPGLNTIPTDKWIDGLWHFHYSAVNGQAQTEFYYRVAPATTWTLVFSDTAANLVRTNTSDAGIDVHYGVYKPESFQPAITVIKGPIVVATTRQEAEDTAFGTGIQPPPPPPPASCDQACEDAYKAQITDLKQQLSDMTASRDAWKARAEKAESLVAHIHDETAP